NLMIRFCKILNPDFNYSDGIKIVGEDFVRDSRGNESGLSYDLFYQSIFELSDIWCPDIDGRQYADFLDKLFRRMTVKVRRLVTGETVKIMPAQRLPPPASPRPPAKEGEEKGLAGPTTAAVAGASARRSSLDRRGSLDRALHLAGIPKLSAVSSQL